MPSLRHITRSVLAAIVAFSTFMVYITWSETPAYDHGAVLVFIWTAIIGIAGYRFLAEESGLGYALSIVTGLMAASFLVLLWVQVIQSAPGAPFVIEVVLSLSYSALGILLAVLGVIAPLRDGTVADSTFAKPSQ